MDGFLCIRKRVFKPGKSERDEDERLARPRIGRERGGGGLERQRQAENWRMELSAGYIWGLCDS